MTFPFSVIKTGDALKKIWAGQPLMLIMVLAVFFRLFAAIFAKGWGMLDDHFLVIEASQSWVDGYDYNDWLPGSKNNTGPSGHNFFYPGIHYLLFKLMHWGHLNDPQLKMLIVRFLHGAFSLITVYFGYRIVETLQDKRSAKLAGILLAIYFFMPWISVRNLVESACIPFLILGYWYMMKPVNPLKPLQPWLLAGLFFGLAADVRYQSVLFPAGVVIYLIFGRKWKEAALIAGGVFCSFLVVQTLIDIMIWGYPFAEVMGYVKVNITDRNSYFTQPWYNYFLTAGGILLPPVSLFLFYGFIRGWKRYGLIFFPAALFFAFHSYFPNKQERFILPFLPFLIMAGSMGYYRYIASSGFWTNRKRLLHAFWTFFWVVNLILLAGLTVMYSKRDRVESMYYLSKYPYLKEIIAENEDGGVPLLPIFYTGKWPHYPEVHPPDTSIYQVASAIAKKPKFYHPQFVIFTGSKNLPDRLALMRRSLPYLVYETTIEPGFIDLVMHLLNPVNKANRAYIYRNREFYKTKAVD